jgi:glucose-6-phosphate-specific signal transduction histidine kinase
MTIFGYYYYRLYSYYSNGGGIPFFSTFCLIFIFFYCNVITVVTIVEITFNQVIKLPAFKGGSLGFFWPMLLIIPSYLFFYHFLRKKGYHELIIDKFKNENRRQRRTSIIFLILYFLVSITLFILTLWLRQVISGY